MSARRTLLAALAAPILLAGAAAQPARADEATAALANALAERYTVPRYAALAEAAETLSATLTGLCAGEQPLEAARQAYHRAMDAWMAIQHLRFGPVDYLNRRARLYFWPDKTNALGKQLPRALAAAEPGLLEPEGLARASVALQGLPALERLLFDETDQPSATDYGCALARAIGANVATMAAGTLHDWRDAERSYLDLIEAADSSDDLFIDSTEVLNQFFAALHEALVAGDELRLGRPLGEAGGRPRPRRAESWRSGRSLRNVTVILESAAAMVEGPEGSGFAALLRTRGAAELADRLVADVAATRAAAAALEPPLAEAVEDAARRPAVEALRAKLRALHKLLSSEVAPALDLVLGFNAMDGD